MNFLYEKKTNLAYKINSFTSRPPQMDMSSKEIWILGRPFKIEGSEPNDAIKKREQLDQLLSTIAWFSYTKNFDPICSEGTNNVITSDAGWGCMIRAGQMMLFTLLLRMFSDGRAMTVEEITKLKYFLLKAYFRERVTKPLSSSWLFGLANPRLSKNMNEAPLLQNDQLKEDSKPEDDRKSQAEKPSLSVKEEQAETGSPKSDECESEEKQLGIFSLQNFAAKANELFQKPLGNWFRPTTFLLILKKMLKTRPEFDNFAAHNVVENVFYLKSLAHKALGLSAEELKSISTNEECLEALCSKPWKRKIALSITTLLGMDRTEARYQPILSRLMEVSSFAGMLGGYQQSAYYFVGKKSAEDYYFLDPHYVKYSLDDFEDRAKLDRHFFDKSFLEINYGKMCSSVSIVFFLNGCDAFREFSETLRSLEDRYKDDFFLAYFLDKVDDRDLANDIISF
jgi:hypothetical protein